MYLGNVSVSNILTASQSHLKLILCLGSSRVLLPVSCNFSCLIICMMSCVSSCLSLVRNVLPHLVSWHLCIGKCLCLVQKSLDSTTGTHYRYQLKSANYLLTTSSLIWTVFISADQLTPFCFYPIAPHCFYPSDSFVADGCTASSTCIYLLIRGAILLVIKLAPPPEEEVLTLTNPNFWKCTV